MKFFVISLLKNVTISVTRSEFYVNESPVLLALHIYGSNTHTTHRSYCPDTLQLSNIYICYETNYNRIVDRIVDLNSRASLLVIVPGRFRNICSNFNQPNPFFLNKYFSENLFVFLSIKKKDKKKRINVQI